jgi:NAD dependent epimerase/dehydratase family enzyme
MSELITEGQFVLPTKALAEGFNFKYVHLDDAIVTVV